MKLRTTTARDRSEIATALEYLEHARDCLVRARCPKTANAVRRALKSADGALRHAVRAERHAAAVCSRDLPA